MEKRPMRHEVRDWSFSSRERRGGSVPEGSKIMVFRAWLRLRVANFRISGPISLCEPTDLLREMPDSAPERVNAGLVIQVSVAVEGQR